MQYTASRWTPTDSSPGSGTRVRALRARARLDAAASSPSEPGCPRASSSQLEAGDGEHLGAQLADLAAGARAPRRPRCSPARRRGRTLPVVALLGLRGAGKTTIGRRLARRLRVPFVELDQRIEEAAGLTPRRDLRAARRGVLPPPRARGAGARARRAPPARARDRRRLVDLARDLRAPAAPRAHGLAAREARGPLEPRGRAGRPAADGGQPARDGRAAALLAAREPLYAQAAHVVDTTRGLEKTSRAVEGLAGISAPR